jgi:hypothetical protein
VKAISWILRTGGIVLATLTLAAPAGAQSAAPGQPRPRADASGTLGWLAVEKKTAFDNSDWHHTLFGSVGAGWYWNDHLKTEVDFGVGREGTQYTSRQIVIDGRPAFEATESKFSRRMLGISQQYQFFKNAWVHPHIAAGFNITWERVTDTRLPIFIFDRGGPGRLIEPERTEGPHTDVTVTPFVATGFKAYLTPRAFFRSDLRVGGRSGIDDVLLRFGFGVDF